MVYDDDERRPVFIEIAGDTGSKLTDELLVDLQHALGATSAVEAQSDGIGTVVRRGDAAALAEALRSFVQRHDVAVKVAVPGADLTVRSAADINRAVRSLLARRSAGPRDHYDQPQDAAPPGPDFDDD